MKDKYTDTERLNQILANCEIRSKYTSLTFGHMDRDDIDLLLDAEAYYAAVDDKQLQKQQEQKAAYMEEQNNETRD